MASHHITETVSARTFYDSETKVTLREYTSELEEFIDGLKRRGRRVLKIKGPVDGVWKVKHGPINDKTT